MKTLEEWREWAMKRYGDLKGLKRVMARVQAENGE